VTSPPERATGRRLLVYAAAASTTRRREPARDFATSASLDSLLAITLPPRWRACATIELDRYTSTPTRAQAVRRRLARATFRASPRHRDALSGGALPTSVTDHDHPVALRRPHVRVPGDKSIAHRLCTRRIAPAEPVLRGFAGGEDNRATRDACCALGLRIDERVTSCASTARLGTAPPRPPTPSTAATPAPRCGSYHLAAAVHSAASTATPRCGAARCSG